MNRSRSGIAGIVWTSLAALALAGCIQQDEKAKVEKDGSGTSTSVVKIDAAAMKQLKEMTAGFMKGFGGIPGGEAPPAPGGPGMEGGPGMDGPPGMDGAPGAPPDGTPPAPSEDAQMKKIKDKLAKAGVELKDAKVETVDGNPRYSIEVAFKSIEAYAKSSLLPFSTELTKNEDGTYTLKFEMKRPGMGGMGMGGAVRPGAPGGDGAPGGAGGESPGAPGGDGAGGMGGMGGMGAMFEPLLSGLEFKRTLTLPAAIRDTNGTKSEDGMTVSWTVTFKDVSAGEAVVQTVTFAGEGIDWKPFKVKADRSLFSDRRSGAPDGAPEGGPR